jgi:hypothetical protein
VTSKPRSRGADTAAGASAYIRDVSSRYLSTLEAWRPCAVVRSDHRRHDAHVVGAYDVGDLYVLARVRGPRTHTLYERVRTGIWPGHNAAA